MMDDGCLTVWTGCHMTSVYLLNWNKSMWCNCLVNKNVISNNNECYINKKVIKNFNECWCDMFILSEFITISAEVAFFEHAG